MHETLLDDCFNTANVDEVKRKRSVTGLFHPLFPVPLGEPHQFLRLPESRPGEGPRKKEFGEVSGCGADLTGLLDIVGAAPHRIGGLLFRVVVKIS